MKSYVCVVYQYDSKIAIFGQARTPEGIGVACEPWILLSDNLGAEVVGQAAHLAARGVSHSVTLESSPSDKELLRFLGARSWKNFAPGAKSVHVILRNDSATVVPYRPGEKHAFFPQHELAITTSQEARELGIAILESLGKQGPT